MKERQAAAAAKREQQAAAAAAKRERQAAAAKREQQAAAKREQQEAKAAAKREQQEAAAAEKEKESLKKKEELQQWIGDRLHEKKEVDIATKLHHKIDQMQKETLDQIALLWFDDAEESNTKLKSAVLSMTRMPLSLKKEYIARYLRLKLYEKELESPISNDVYLKQVQARISMLSQRNAQTKVVFGTGAICHPSSHEDVELLMEKIDSKLKIG